MGVGADRMAYSVSLGLLVLVIQLISQSEGCGYRLLTPSLQNDGYISSPNYPLPYPSNVCVKWVYNGEPGTQVTIRILDLDIRDCENDYLRIGPLNRKTYCGLFSNEIIRPYHATQYASNYQLYIIFNSTGNGSKGRGFHLHYQISHGRENMVDGASSSRSKTTTTLAKSSTTSISPPTAAVGWNAQPGDCRYVITRVIGTGTVYINSSIVKSAVRNQFCSWTMYGKGVIYFHCNLPAGDNLEIYDGVDDSYSRFGTYADRRCPHFLVIRNGVYIRYFPESAESSPEVTISFHSSETMQPLPYPGGSQAHTTVRHKPVATATDRPLIMNNFPSHCQFVYENQSGRITLTASTIKAMRLTGHCEWQLYSKAPFNRHISYQLNFEKCDLNDGDHVEVFDGFGETNRLLGSYQGLSRPSTLTSRENAVFIKFTPRYSWERNANFTIDYTVRELCPPGYEPCGYGELDCFKSIFRCDGYWNCPKRGGDERRCSKICPEDHFACNRNSSYCYREKDRCNGHGTCSNYRDELSCTAEQCSANKGLFLCRNGRCIYEKWKCDRTNDCEDHSDEQDCSSLSSPRVIVAAVVGSLVCALLLVIALGCVCKVYHLRMRQLRGPRLETPLSRQLAEMFHRRAPPPPYHEAMVTSRPYDEAYMELLNQEEDNQGDALDGGDGDHVSSNTTTSTERPRRSRMHPCGRRCRHNSRHREVNQDQATASARHGSEPNGLIDVGTLPLLAEMLGSDTGNGDHSLLSDLPPYSESDPSLAGHESCSDSDNDNSSEEEAWQDRFDNVAGCGVDDSQINMDRESLIELEMTAEAIRNIPDPLSSESSVSQQGHLNGSVLEEADNDKDAETASTSLSVDSTSDASGVMKEEEEEKKEEEHMSVIEEDSDSDCILADNDEDEDDGNDDTDSDTACLLSRK